MKTSENQKKAPSKKRKSKQKPKSLRKCEYQVARCRKSLLTGHVLVIDPSSGSASSLPGYAVFKKGQLVDSGVIQVDISRELPRRLQEVAATLQKEFEEVDVLVIEDIPSRSFGRNSHAHATLLKSVGVYLANCRYRQFVEISPSVWHAFLRTEPEGCSEYKKGDEWDAIVMGHCALAIAKGDF